MELKEVIEFYKNSSQDILAKKANEVCEQIYGKKIFLRGLIEFSNLCDRDCLYCGIRKSNPKVIRYKLTEKEIIDAVMLGYSAGLKTFVLQSGESKNYSLTELCRISEKIKKLTDNNSALTLSCGIFTKKEYRSLKLSGVDRYLIRFETSDPVLHKYLRNGISLKRRLKAIEDLKELEYETGSGYMVGLPGETEEIRINNAILCYKLKLDMIGIGPFIPHPETPLKKSIKHNIGLALKAISLIRLLLPYSNIPATTAIGSIDKEGREKALKSGANVLMPNITPVKYKKNYLLYPDKICIEENGADCIRCLKIKLKKTGKVISYEKGDSKAKEINYA